jgi:DNA (cytosine-5)-methyltransferase 1
LTGLIIDNFAGGGGASTGIEAALGRAIDIAINHDEEAIRMHEANHPATLHIRNNVWQVDPEEICAGRPVQLAWFSPDCKHFSKAKGGKPREKSIRDLAWVVVLWAQRVRPDVILLENVEEFRTWGPLDDEGFPIKERAGETFAKWCRSLRKAGYRLQFKELRACDYGAPTIRKRFFMIARSDGKPIVWPSRTHGKPDSPEVKAGKRKPWRTAAEIIDWSIPCPSIFERKKPLAEKTLRRIAHGIMKFVVNNPSPFIVPICNTNWAGDRFYPGDEPLRTITTAKGGEQALVMPHITKFRAGTVGHGADEPLHTVTANSYVKRPGGAAPLGVVEALVSPVIVGCGGRRGQSGPAGPEQPYPTTTAKADACVAAAHLVHIGNGEREGQAPRAMDIEKPLGTVVAGGVKHHAVTAFMHRYAAHIEQANGGPNNENLAGRAADDPLSTVATKGSQQRLVTSNLVKLRGTSAHGQPIGDPLHTVSAQGLHMAEVRAFLLKYYGTDQDPQLGEPLHTVTTKDRYGLVTVSIDGEEYVIVDIGMRMLSPRELFNAQGFPPDYIIAHDARGKPITKTAQVAKCGNSVCPPLAEALTRAQFPDVAAERRFA